MFLFCFLWPKNISKQNTDGDVGRKQKQLIIVQEEHKQRCRAIRLDTYSMLNNSWFLSLSYLTCEWVAKIHSKKFWWISRCDDSIQRNNYEYETKNNVILKRSFRIREKPAFELKLGAKHNAVDSWLRQGQPEK